MVGEMVKDDIKEWVNKNYPDGVIDWKTEYERLLNVVEQAMPSIQNSEGQSFCAVRLLKTALEVGEYLVNQPSAEDWDIYAKRPHHIDPGDMEYLFKRLSEKPEERDNSHQA
jgi:hypothetical protein